jgi:DNA-binding transcriptional LysR family regulator
MSFEELRAFLVVVDQGSFLSAAAALNVSRTTLRRQVDALEARAGVPLLMRDRNGVVLTEAGRQLVRRGRVMEQEFSSLLSAIRDTGRRATGLVRILMPVGLPPPVLAAVYGLVRTNWPELRVRLRFREAPLPSTLTEADVVIWFGDGEPAGAWHKTTFLEMPQRLVASKGYLDSRGAPRSLDELARHDILAWLPPDEIEPRPVTLDGEPVSVRPVLNTSDVHVLHECARLGLGIAWAPDAGALAGIGEPLVPVLEGVVGRRVRVNVAVPRALAALPKVRVLMEHLDAIRALVLVPPSPPPPASTDEAAPSQDARRARGDRG